MASEELVKIDSKSFAAVEKMSEKQNNRRQVPQNVDMGWLGGMGLPRWPSMAGCGVCLAGQRYRCTLKQHAGDDLFNKIASAIPGAAEKKP